MRINRGAIIALITLIAFICLGVLGYNTIYYSNLEVVIDGEHNPVSSQIRANGDLLYPSGNEGRTYSGKVRPGTVEVTLSGPGLETENKNINISVFGSESVSFTSVPVSALSTAAGLVSTTNENKISYASFYGTANDWIVIKSDIVASGTVAGSTFYIYRYSLENNGWILELSDNKIDQFDEKLRNAPIELLNYVGTEASD